VAVEKGTKATAVDAIGVAFQDLTFGNWSSSVHRQSDTMIGRMDGSTTGGDFPNG
jgi:hypothetical protein